MAERRRLLTDIDERSLAAAELIAVAAAAAGAQATARDEHAAAERSAEGADADAEAAQLRVEAARSTLAALAARDAGLPVPAGQVLLSALTSGDMQIKFDALGQHRDALFPFMTVKFIYDVFATVNGTRPVPVMPSEANMTGLGPFLLQIGTEEMLRNDTFTLADRLRADGVPVWVQVWDKAMHMFQLSFDVNPDARTAIGEIASFIAYVTAPARDEAAS